MRYPGVPCWHRRRPAALASAATKKAHIPIGLELYSVREQLKQDLMGTVRGVAKMGYEDVEFYSPYFEWTAAYAKDVRKLLDDLGIRCLSTHNGSEYFSADKLPHAIELNQILGSKFVVMASAGRVENLDGWKGVADKLNQAEEKLKPLGLHAGFHNHLAEFKPMGGKRPMDVLAANTVQRCGVATRRGHLRGSGVGPGRVDQCESRAHPVDAREGVVAAKGLPGAVWRGRGPVEERSSRLPRKPEGLSST